MFNAWRKGYNALYIDINTKRRDEQLTIKIEYILGVTR